MIVNNEAKIRGFDFHCHVDLHPNPPDLIREYEEHRIAVLAVTTTPKAWPQNREWTKNCKFVHAAAGLHPELVGLRSTEIELLEEAIANTRLVGEIGLDGSPQHRGSYAKQKEVFKRSLVSAQTHGGRVLTIHSRRAVRDVIEAIGEYTDSSRVLCILHWFLGSLTELRRAAELGCYFSVNAAMLHHERGARLVQSIPRDRLLTETDSPFAKVGYSQTLHWHTVNMCEQLAKVMGDTSVTIKQQLAENANKVIQFADISIDCSI